MKQRNRTVYLRRCLCAAFFVVALTSLLPGLAMPSPVDDGLTGTFWSNAPKGEEDISLSFASGGKVTFSLMYDDDLKGTYSVSGSTVSLSFEGGRMTGSGSISGDKMTVTGIVNSRMFPKGVVLTRR